MLLTLLSAIARWLPGVHRTYISFIWNIALSASFGVEDPSEVPQIRWKSLTEMIRKAILMYHFTGCGCEPACIGCLQTTVAMLDHLQPALLKEDKDMVVAMSDGNTLYRDFVVSRSCVAFRWAVQVRPTKTTRSRINRTLCPYIMLRLFLSSSLNYNIVCAFQVIAVVINFWTVPNLYVPHPKGRRSVPHPVLPPFCFWAEQWRVDGMKKGWIPGTSAIDHQNEVIDKMFGSHSW